MITRHWLVRLYPRPWRERYGDEFDALLEECLHSPLDVLDILLGAIDAHLGLAQETNWRAMNMANKLRTTFLIVFTAYIGFIIGGLSFYGLVDDSPAAALMKTDLPLATAWKVVQSGSVISLLAVVAAGLPLAWAVLRQLMTSSRRDLRYLLVPVVAFLALVLYGALLAAVANGWVQIPGVARTVTPDNFPTGNRLILGGFMVVFVIGAIAATAAVWKVLSNTQVEDTTQTGKARRIQPYTYTFPLAMVATLGMVVMLVATLAFGWLASSALPQWFAGNYGLLLVSTRLSFAGTLTIMALSAVLALFGLARGYPYRKRSFA